jgi:hypothetical protein
MNDNVSLTAPTNVGSPHPLPFLAYYYQARHGTVNKLPGRAELKRKHKVQ